MLPQFTRSFSVIFESKASYEVKERQLNILLKGYRYVNKSQIYAVWTENGRSDYTTPLSCALTFPEFKKYDVNYTSYTTTALHLAKEKSSIEILLEAGADVAAKNRLGRTPLDIFLLRLDYTYTVHEVEFIMCLDLLIQAI